MTLSQFRTQVDALCRKYAAEPQAYRLSPWPWNSETGCSTL